MYGKHIPFNGNVRPQNMCKYMIVFFNNRILLLNYFPKTTYQLNYFPKTTYQHMPLKQTNGHDTRRQLTWDLFRNVPSMQFWIHIIVFMPLNSDITFQGINSTLCTGRRYNLFMLLCMYCHFKNIIRGNISPVQKVNHFIISCVSEDFQDQVWIEETSQNRLRSYYKKLLWKSQWLRKNELTDIYLKIA